MSFDLILENLSNTETIKLNAIKAKGYNKANTYVGEWRIDSNGPSPSIQIIKNELKPQDQLVVFNPFDSFDGKRNISKLLYEIKYKLGETEYTSAIQVELSPYEQKASYQFPLRGRTIVEDGFDLYSHHRRVDLKHPVLAKIGMQANAGRFAMDLVKIDEKGHKFKNNGSNYEDWYGYADDVYAVSAGRVVTVKNNIPENQANQGCDFKEVIKNPDYMAGNQVIVQDKEGHFQLYAHLLKDSILVQAGQEIIPGMALGKIGVSGCSGHPHLHFEKRNLLSFLEAEGIPTFFETNAVYNTGDIILNDSKHF